MDLIKGNCLDELKKIKDKSVDFVYCDLPYGQTACKWDVKFKPEEWVDFWKELKRIAKSDRTPFFFSCTTKFGYDIIKSNEKWFRWDLVWKKNRAAGFLNAYRLPMRKHEMIYCFAKKSPKYDVSSHSEYIQGDNSKTGKKIETYNQKLQNDGRRHKDPLPTSIIPPLDEHELVYCFAKKSPKYDVSSHNEYTVDIAGKNQKQLGGEHYGVKGKDSINLKRHKVPLPTSIIPPSDEHELVYCFAKKSPEYDVSSHKELLRDKKVTEYDKKDVYGTEKNIIGKVHKDPLPTSIIPPSDEHELVYCFAKKSPEYDVSSHLTGETKIGSSKNNVYLKEFQSRGQNPNYYDKVHIKKEVKDPLPTSIIPDEEPSSWCEFSLDKKVGHRTAKPVKLMEFLLKYWSKEGDVILDPTMGSGSMGIACDNMKRKFIGIEMDDDIYDLAVNRIKKNNPKT